MPRTQVHITTIDAGGEQQRHPAAVDDLHEIGGEEGEVDQQEEGDEAATPRQSGQCHSFQTTTKASAVVTTIVPVTAMP